MIVNFEERYYQKYCDWVQKNLTVLLELTDTGDVQACNLFRSLADPLKRQEFDTRIQFFNAFALREFFTWKSIQVHIGITLYLLQAFRDREVESYDILSVTHGERTLANIEDMLQHGADTHLLYVTTRFENLYQFQNPANFDRLSVTDVFKQPDKDVCYIYPSEQCGDQRLNPFVFTDNDILPLFQASGGSVLFSNGVYYETVFSPHWLLFYEPILIGTY